MNKYIKTDIEQGLKYLKIGIMNALNDLETGEEKEIDFEAPIPLQLIIKCAEERDWKMDDWDLTNGLKIDYWYRMSSPNIKDKCLCVSGSLLSGNTSISLESYV